MHDRVFKHTEAHKLEDPERLKWLPPAEVLAHLRLAPGMKVVDIGAGTGYFGMPIAHVLGTLGHVFAVDLQPEMLDLLKQKLSLPGAPTNVSLHQAAASKLPLQDDSVDIVFYANIWHELDDLDSTFREAARVSVPGGMIAILDWRSDCAPPPGPPQDHRISDGSVISFLKLNGCRNVVSKHVGQFGYLVIAELNGSHPVRNST